MKILELFSGTESFSKVARERGHEVFTIDMDQSFNPSLCKDILNVEVKDIPFKPDVIWASPPCTAFSVASLRHYWKEGKPKSYKTFIGLAIVKKAIELIQELNPKNGHGPTAFVRKALEEQKKGKTSVLILPVLSLLNMLFDAKAEIRPVGRVRWVHAETGEKWKQPSNCALFILRGKK